MWLAAQASTASSFTGGARISRHRTEDASILTSGTAGCSVQACKRPRYEQHSSRPLFLPLALPVASKPNVNEVDVSRDKGMSMRDFWIQSDIASHFCGCWVKGLFLRSTFPLLYHLLAASTRANMAEPPRQNNRVLKSKLN